MYRGIHHVGVGVSTMSDGLSFYRDCLGFSDVLFDYSGPLPGMQKVTGKPNTNARVVMLANPNVGHYGLGMIKLVELLLPDKASPLPEGIGWGEIGTAELCLEVYQARDVVKDLVEKKGCVLAMELEELPSTSKMFYILDPQGGKLECIERPNMAGNPQRILGVYHVAFGVSDIMKSAEFYKGFGFTELIWDFEGVMESMNPWHGKAQGMKIVMLGNYRGASVELVQQIPEVRDCRGEWGHLGPMDYAIEVTNIDKACEELNRKGIELLSDPQTIEVAGGRWRYVFFVEPDGNFVSLIEQRF